MYYLFFSGHGLTTKQLEQKRVLFGIIHIAFQKYILRKKNMQNKILVAVLGEQISKCI